jgi:hypothetical protein
MSKLMASLAVALLAAYVFHALAQSPIDARPALTPLNSSSSNGVSCAWFFETGSHTVYVCRATQSAATPLDCTAKATLP